jgi:hypothetical protein
MERSKTQYVDNTAQLSSAGLIIRQKEPKNLESPFDRIDSYLTPSCSTSAVIFRYQTWTAPLITCASMVRSGVRLL